MINHLKISYVILISFIGKFNRKLVRLLGFEPRTFWFVTKRSIQLSYRRRLLNISNIFNIEKNNKSFNDT